MCSVWSLTHCNSWEQSSLLPTTVIPSSPPATDHLLQPSPSTPAPPSSPVRGGVGGGGRSQKAFRPSTHYRNQAVKSFCHLGQDHPSGICSLLSLSFKWWGCVTTCGKRGVHWGEPIDKVTSWIGIFLNDFPTTELNPQLRNI